MPKDKIKPPAETKAQLMEQVHDALDRKFKVHPDDAPAAAIDFLLNFFTAADLVGIRDELSKYPGAKE